MPHKEEEVRAYVKELKQLYQDIFISCCIFAVALLAWLTTGGPFWPFWVFLALGSQSVVRLIVLGKIPLSSLYSWVKKISFFTPEWQEELVQKILRGEDEDTDNEAFHKPARTKKNEQGKSTSHAKTNVSTDSEADTTDIE